MNTKILTPALLKAQTARVLGIKEIAKNKATILSGTTEGTQEALEKLEAYRKEKGLKFPRLSVKPVLTVKKVSNLFDKNELPTGTRQLKALSDSLKVEQSLIENALLKAEVAELKAKLNH